MADERGAYGYPAAVQLDLPYRDPAKPQNPALKGTVLSIAATIVTSVASIAKYFYTNAGFSKQLGEVKEYERAIATYNPVVVPANQRSNASEASVPPTDLSAYRGKSTAESSSGRYRTSLDYYEAYKSGRTTPTAVVEALLPLIRRDVPKPTKHSKEMTQINRQCLVIID